MILIPVKNLDGAKQRLAPVLDQSARTELAQAMLFDVLQTLSTYQHRPPVALITSDPFACQMALRFNFEVIEDSVNSGETDAIAMATQVCLARGIESSLVLPGDIPLVQAWELERIFTSAPEQGSVLVPAADGRGTNAIWQRPVGLFPLRFGNDSFKPHLAAAQATQKPCVVLDLPGIALDVDRPADLRQLASAPGETSSQQLVRQWDALDLAPAANE